MSATGEAFTHAVDPGGPITVIIPADVGARAKERRLRLETSSCTSPECACIETDIELTEDGAEASATLRFDPTTRVFEIVRDRAGLLDGGLDPWLQAELTGSTGDYIETRARRAKLQDHAHPWRLHDWSKHRRGNLVSYFEAVPGDFDLLAQLDGESFWAHDMYCVSPRCDCHQAVLEFHACGANGAHERSGQALGLLRVDLMTGQITEAEQPRGRPVFEALRRAYSIDELRHRYGRMRDMAQDVGPHFGQAKTAPVSVAPRVERNQHCPCGSGKKYKKCCGAPASRSG